MDENEDTEKVSERADAHSRWLSAEPTLVLRAAVLMKVRQVSRNLAHGGMKQDEATLRFLTGQLNALLDVAEAISNPKPHKSLHVEGRDAVG